MGRARTATAQPAQASDPNIVVLWNTIYIGAALGRLRAEKYDVRLEDVARLSPIGHNHVNMLGRYAFTLPDTVARGELRPCATRAQRGSTMRERAW